MDLQLGVELTLLPKVPGRYKEFLRKPDAIRAASQLNAALRASPHSQLHTLRAKADIFRIKEMTRINGHYHLGYDWQPHNSWCIEVNGKPINSADFVYRGNQKAFEDFYRIAASLNLYPRFEHTKRDGTVVQNATGGNHWHTSIALWRECPNYFIKLHCLQRFLVLDFANTPSIRWFFSQWFDDTNSHNLATWTDPDKVAKMFAKNRTRESGFDLVTDDVLSSLNMQQRFTAHGKAIFPTWEHRYTDMPANEEELRFQATFLHKWFQFYSDGIVGENVVDFFKDHSRFTLTQRSFNRQVREPDYCKEQLLAFFRKIGVDIAHQVGIIDTIFNRNCLNRLNHGKTLP